MQGKTNSKLNSNSTWKKWGLQLDCLTHRCIIRQNQLKVCKHRYKQKTQHLPRSQLSQQQVKQENTWPAGKKKISVEGKGNAWVADSKPGIHFKEMCQADGEGWWGHRGLLYGGVTTKQVASGDQPYLMPCLCPLPTSQPGRCRCRDAKWNMRAGFFSFHSCPLRGRAPGPQRGGGGEGMGQSSDSHSPSVCQPLLPL